jgi:hypothetical protein
LTVTRMRDVSLVDPWPSLTLAEISDILVATNV